MTLELEQTMYEYNLDPDDPEDVERFMKDQVCCNCDEGYQCFNLACRERVEKERDYYARLFSNPAVREHYRPVYGYEGGIRYKIDYGSES
jgi:hypothetical protein